MKMINREIIDNCFEGEFVIKYIFDSTWTRDKIKALDMMGRLKYYESFPKPMFQLTCSDGIIIKGVQGTNECRIIYAYDRQGEAKTNFEKRLEEIINSF